MPRMRWLRSITVVTAFSTVTAIACVHSVPPALAASVIVMFKPGVVSLPAGTTKVSIDEAIYSPVQLESSLSGMGVDSLTVAFPGFDLADTLVTLPSGEQVDAPNQSLIYTLSLESGANADPVIALLNASSDVV